MRRLFRHFGMRLIVIGALLASLPALFVISQALASAPDPSDAQTVGQWSGLMSWPMVAIHSVLLKNGNVLQFDGWQQPEPTQVWNPNTQTFTTQTAPDSIFCSGMAELPDGRVITVGGYGGLSTGQAGIVDTSIFDPSTSTWTRVADMHYPRWYPSLTELSDGRYVAISGLSSHQTGWADTPEVYDPSSNTWTVLSNVSTSQVHESEYPFSYLVPNGDVFTIGPYEDKSFLLDVGAQTWSQVGGASGVTNGSSVMYRPGKIMYSGGTNSQTSGSPANATTAVIDLTSGTPQWRQTAKMNYPRVYHTLTMLADGTVLAVGGEPSWRDDTGTTETSGGVLPSEIWNPNTETWSVVASTGVTRGYHSTALLMPDGTVLVAGSGHDLPNYAGQYSAQTYSPPYLFKGPRPTISSVAASAAYGHTIPVSTPDAGSISAVNLVSLGADTHQSDMNQHFVPLSFTKGSGSLNVQIPGSGAVAPPGNYMLFIVNSSGVPSVASIIHVDTTSGPDSPANVVASAGNGTATVSWSAPSDGGSPITSYTVTPYIGSAAQTPTTVTGSPPATTTTIGGLTNGSAYTFTVTATNAVASSLPSSASGAVTPTAPASTAGTTAPGGSPTPTTATTASPPTGGSTQGASATRPPRLTLLKVTPRAFMATSRTGRATANRSTGPTISYTDSQPATTTLTVSIAQQGVTRGKRCVTPPKRGVVKPTHRCTLYAPLETLRHADRAGVNHVFVSGLGKRKLVPGHYRLDATPRAHDRTGATARAAFTVTRYRASAAIARQASSGQNGSYSRRVAPCMTTSASTSSSTACKSYRRAARIAAAARARFVFEALLNHLPLPESCSSAFVPVRRSATRPRR